MFKLSKPDIANDLQQKRNGKYCLRPCPPEFVPDTLLKQIPPEGSKYFFGNFGKQHLEGGSGPRVLKKCLLSKVRTGKTPPLQGTDVPWLGAGSWEDWFHGA